MNWEKRTPFKPFVAGVVLPVTAAVLSTVMSGSSITSLKLPGVPVQKDLNSAGFPVLIKTVPSL